MAQFGAGVALAAQCPTVPPPDGWEIWTDANGPIPDGLSQRAQAMVLDQTVALGATESYPLPGVTALIRVEPHVWSRDAQGNLVQGCYRASVIYLLSTEVASPTSSDDTAAPTSSSVSSMDKTIGVLTIASLAVGTVATLATWGK